jgi:hypothetical protein
MDGAIIGRFYFLRVIFASFYRVTCNIFKGDGR